MINKTMPIRKAALKDVKLIARINTLSEDPTDKAMGIKEPWVVKHFTEGIKSNDFRVFIYGDAGVMTLKPDFPGYKNYEIYWLTVAKQHKGKGIGTKLMRFAEQYAKKMKQRGLYLYAYIKNKKAIKFYNKLGYKKINTFKNYYSNGDTAVLLGKVLK